MVYEPESLCLVIVEVCCLYFFERFEVFLYKT